MRAFRISLLSVLAVAPALAAQESLDGLAWLAGGWRGDVGGAIVEEHWLPASGHLMLGVSHTVADGKAVGFEFLRIEARPDGIIYIAQPNGRPGTEFELTELDGQSAVFENPEHDHPKRIRYRKNPDGDVTVEIDGDEGQASFHLRPIPSP